MKYTDINTPLALLLTRLRISSLDLASAIHVDPSLISRWKNGQRRFDDQSEHYANAINFFLDRDEKVDYRNIIVFLEDYMADWDFSSRQQIYEGLDKWMSGLNCAIAASAHHHPAYPIDVSEFGIIRGEHKKKEMLLHFLDSAISLPNKKNIYIMLDQETNAMLDYSAFYDSWSEKLKTLISNGQEIYFIYALRGADPFITALDNFLAFCFAPNVHAYYLPKSTVGSSVFNLFIIDGVLALTDFIYNPNRHRPVLFSFSNTDIILKLKDMYLNIFNSCNPLIKKGRNFSHIPLIASSFANEQQGLCVLDSAPYMFPIAPETFNAILTYNQFDESQKKMIMNNYMTVIYHPLMDSNQTYRRNHIIWNTDLLSESMANDVSLFPSRLLADYEIKIPKAFYKKYLEQAIDYILLMENNKQAPFNLSVIDNSFEALPNDILIYAIDNIYTYIYSYSSEYEQKTLSFTNPAITADTYMYLSNIWYNLGNENKSSQNILRFLMKLLKQLD